VLSTWGTAVWLGLTWDPKGFIDLVVYRVGGQAWITGIPLYGPEFPALVGSLPLPFTYPPVAAVLFASLAVAPLPVAVTLLTAASLGCLAGVAWLVARRLEPDRRRATGLAAVAVVLGTVTEPVRETLTFGQVNLILMALVVADCLLPRTWWPRGTLIGLAAAIKLTPAVFVLFFLAHRQWRPALTAAAAFTTATVIGFLAAPTASARYWFGGVLTDPERIGAPGFPSNQSLAAVLHRAGLPTSWQTALWLLGAVGVMAAGGVAVRRLRQQREDVAALLVVAAVGLLASPVSWSHHYVWAVPALVWCGYRALLSPWWWPALVMLAVVVTVGPHWLVATREDAMPDWGAGAQLIGNAYVWLALLALAVMFQWVSSSRASAAASAATLARTAGSIPGPEGRTSGEGAAVGSGGGSGSGATTCA
jgi:alpha-1,2-mannosyltransferase